MGGAEEGVLGRVPFTAFESADLRLVHPDANGELVLRQPAMLAVFAELGREVVMRPEGVELGTLALIRSRLERTDVLLEAAPQ